SCPDPTRPACQHSGVLAGACTECSATNGSRCGGAKPICLTDLGICGCKSSDGDSECGNATSGVVCSSPSAGICEPGCSVAPGRNGCPAPETCSDPDGGIGFCQAGCNGNGDCTVAPLLRCDQPAHTCVQCLGDTDCTRPLLC